MFRPSESGPSSKPKAFIADSLKVSHGSVDSTVDDAGFHYLQYSLATLADFEQVIPEDDHFETLSGDEAAAEADRMSKRLGVPLSPRIEVTKAYTGDELDFEIEDGGDRAADARSSSGTTAGHRLKVELVDATSAYSELSTTQSPQLVKSAHSAEASMTSVVIPKPKASVEKFSEIQRSLVAQIERMQRDARRLGIIHVSPYIHVRVLASFIGELPTAHKVTIFQKYTRRIESATVETVTQQVFDILYAFLMLCLKAKNAATLPGKPEVRTRLEPFVQYICVHYLQTRHGSKFRLMEITECNANFGAWLLACNEGAPVLTTDEQLSCELEIAQLKKQLERSEREKSHLRQQSMLEVSELQRALKDPELLDDEGDDDAEEDEKAEPRLVFGERRRPSREDGLVVPSGGRDKSAGDRSETSDDSVDGKEVRVGGARSGGAAGLVFGVKREMVPASELVHWQQEAERLHELLQAERVKTGEFLQQWETTDEARVWSNLRQGKVLDEAIDSKLELIQSTSETIEVLRQHIRDLSLKVATYESITASD